MTIEIVKSGDGMNNHTENALYIKNLSLVIEAYKVERRDLRRTNAEQVLIQVHTCSEEASCLLLLL